MARAGRGRGRGSVLLRVALPVALSTLLLAFCSDSEPFEASPPPPLPVHHPGDGLQPVRDCLAERGPPEGWEEFGMAVSPNRARGYRHHLQPHISFVAPFDIAPELQGVAPPYAELAQKTSYRNWPLSHTYTEAAARARGRVSEVFVFVEPFPDTPPGRPGSEVGYERRFDHDPRPPDAISGLTELRSVEEYADLEFIGDTRWDFQIFAKLRPCSDCEEGQIYAPTYRYTVIDFDNDAIAWLVADPSFWFVGYRPDLVLALDIFKSSPTFYAEFKALGGEYVVVVAGLSNFFGQLPLILQSVEDDLAAFLGACEGEDEGA